MGRGSTFHLDRRIPSWNWAALHHHIYISKKVEQGHIAAKKNFPSFPTAKTQIQNLNATKQKSTRHKLTSPVVDAIAHLQLLVRMIIRAVDKAIADLGVPDTLPVVDSFLVAGVHFGSAVPEIHPFAAACDDGAGDGGRDEGSDEQGEKGQESRY